MTAEELAGLIGDEAAMLFIARQGGQRYIVPKNASPRIIDHMGEKAAAIFVKEYGGCHIFVPVAKPWRAIRLYRRGMSIAQISLALCMTAKGVRGILARENAVGTETAKDQAA